MKVQPIESKEELERFINSEKFKKIEISQTIANWLIEECIRFKLFTEIEIVRSVVMKIDPKFQN